MHSFSRHGEHRLSEHEYVHILTIVSSGNRRGGKETTMQWIMGTLGKHLE